MSTSYYTNIRTTKPKGRKPYRCIWCDERIAKGERHVHDIASFDCRLQSQRFHEECFEALRAYIIESGGMEVEFGPGSHKRGSTEER